MRSSKGSEPPRRTARCVRVPRQDGERVRIELKEAGLLDDGVRIAADGDHLLIPILGDGCPGYETVAAELAERPAAEHDYRALLDLPPELAELLPSAYDVIGDVLIIRIPEGLEGRRHAVGEALLTAHPQVRVVMADTGVKGDLRIRELERIAGHGPSETVHRESGVRIPVDPAAVYFNPRLATERARVAAAVRDGETVIDMFAGAAPFGLIICRNARPAAVHSIDLNPEAERFVREGMRLNRIGNLFPYTGDARSVIRELPPADRVIMNLPQSAELFLEDALEAVRPGGTVHLHLISERSEAAGRVDGLVADMTGRGLPVTVDGIRELKTYSPSMSVYVVDLVRAPPVSGAPAPE